LPVPIISQNIFGETLKDVARAELKRMDLHIQYDANMK